ncbi:hypothetical protein NDU88_004516 [Pleurodeles waltl]|uniref:Uncharacterized protein n=1 Tax=Pleurodeles waltl TaxID=8319 RepID=A0AAV7QIN3_PLEWA|nr:hypothetical protein NDU88_004516 [Pleurodeles waltl]
MYAFSAPKLALSGSKGLKYFLASAPKVTFGASTRWVGCLIISEPVPRLESEGFVVGVAFLGVEDVAWSPVVFLRMEPWPSGSGVPEALYLGLDWVEASVLTCWPALIGLLMSDSCSESDPRTEMAMWIISPFSALRRSVLLDAISNLRALQSLRVFFERKDLQASQVSSR